MFVFLIFLVIAVICFCKAASQDSSYYNWVTKSNGTGFWIIGAFLCLFAFCSLYCFCVSNEAETTKKVLLSSGYVQITYDEMQDLSPNELKNYIRVGDVYFKEVE